MVAFLRTVFLHLQTEKIQEWGRLVTITGLAQVVVYILGFASGILIIRFLSVENFAYYTLANAMLGNMALLADGGISAGVMSQGGKVWQNRDRLGAVLATGLYLRKKFAFGSLLIFLPLLAFLLYNLEAPIYVIILICVAIVPAFYAELSDSLLEIVPKLHQEISSLQKNQVSVGIARLLLMITVVLAFPFSFIALMANGLARIYGNVKLKKIISPYVGKQEPDIEIKKKLISIIKRVFPGTAYYCFSSQITVYILSIFGNTIALAQLGVLTKLVIALSIISTISSILIIPRFARQEEAKSLLLQFYIQTLVTMSILLMLGSAMAYIFSDHILLIFGENYSQLQEELILTVIGGSLTVLAGIAVTLNMSRNWIINPTFFILLNILLVVIGILLFEISELKGVLFFYMFLAGIQLLIHASYGLFKILNLQPAVGESYY